MAATRFAVGKSRQARWMLVIDSSPPYADTASAYHPLAIEAKSNTMHPARHAATVALGLCLGLTAVGSGSAAVTHPLDPLSAQEIETAVKAVAATGRTGRTARAAVIALAEPDKSE